MISKRKRPQPDGPLALVLGSLLCGSGALTAAAVAPDPDAPRTPPTPRSGGPRQVPTS